MGTLPNKLIDRPCSSQFLSQAWIEASTKGAVLLFTASEIESATMAVGVSPAAAGLLGGMGGGIAQAYATMGECTNPAPSNITCELSHDCPG